MKKPEKKEQVFPSHIYNCPECGDGGYVIGYNEACKKLEEYYKWRINDILKRINKEVDALKRRLAK